LQDQTILVTGATRGIGLAAAEKLADRGAKIILHGRDPIRLERARRKLAAKGSDVEVDTVVADLASLDDVRRLASEIDDRCDRLDVLLNNAGLVTRTREQTVDGFERQLAVNHLAPFLLTHLLLDKVKASAPARIVTVASMAHHRAAFDIDDLNWERRKYSGIGAYGATKLANILFTRELARRLEGTSVTANCLHPGVVATNIFTGMGFPGAIFGIVTRPFLLSAHDGSATSVFLASSNDVAAVSGGYFSESKQVEPSSAAVNNNAAAKLWELSAQMTGLTPT
jgi:NAD(P)-dependent dehydrogenase (short-subunit alcohol dehydrogenase family)